ncbi:lysozyme C-like [Lampris incognitus]|uniref:lysozyme C-like n=1 Tax=Lampris incognitus TaxID=2546036 RepID=UPI0024B4D225|nr:lysozyme C-like [Lampris incognitus]
MRGILCLLLVALATAKVFDRCDWARVLKNNGMDGYVGKGLATWVCLAKWLSNYNTSAITHHSDGSTDYGIFQFNSRYWCKEHITRRSLNFCHIQCSELLTDDVSVAIRCVKRAFRYSHDQSGWKAWHPHCWNQGLSSYLAGCSL